MKVLNANDLRGYRTLITNFMCDGTANMKTYANLATIFEKCHKHFTNDPSNDLRILEFEKAMKAGAWTEDIVLTQDSATQIVTDGIHRGIAYLRCVNAGLDEKSLPRLVVVTKDVFGQ